jgi:hypothetical protein
MRISILWLTNMMVYWALQIMGRFGALLWEGGVASLLTERVGVGVQLQAVCLVHLLLYCRSTTQ